MICKDDANYALGYLKGVVDQHCSPGVAKLNKFVLTDERFFNCPGGSEKHHNYRYGLVQHVGEVMSNVLKLTQGIEFDRLMTMNVLVTSVVWHDYCKINEYALEKPKSVKVKYENDEDPRCWTCDQRDCVCPETVGKRPYRKLIGHVAGSYGSFCSVLTVHRAIESVIITRNNKDAIDEFEGRVGHCLLSHHGRLEWRSPVEPSTAESLILHAADMMSAHGVNL